MKRKLLKPETHKGICKWCGENSKVSMCQSCREERNRRENQLSSTKKKLEIHNWVKSLET
jgi:hypothetical protein